MNGAPPPASAAAAAENKLIRTQSFHNLRLCSDGLFVASYNCYLLASEERRELLWLSVAPYFIVLPPVGGWSDSAASSSSSATPFE